MMDPILSLAFSVQSNKGVYALLVGSGISRAAGIPTGWEIILDLTRKVALLQGVDCGADPAAWYRSTFGKEPSYSDLLDALAKSSAERGQLLRPYIEPSQEEREQGKKQPTAAHRAIADLVAGGYLRVLVTTNFDRLLEQALEAIGITPTVIYTPDAVDGSTPLVHSACTVIKVHGDYLDTRLKNTPEELSGYDPRMDALLDRVFDEYGLIVCGWSGDWDTALRDAITRCKSRRYTTYWSSRGKPSPLAGDLITLRRAHVVSIDGADTFFRGLAEKVIALEDASRPHPLSVTAAVESMKRFLPDPKLQIRLHDLVTDEVERVKSLLGGQEFAVQGVRPDGEGMLRRITRYAAVTEILCSLFITSGQWMDDTQTPLMVRAIQRLSDDQRPSGLTVYIHLRMFPCLFLMYAGCLAALAAGRYGFASDLLRQVHVRDNRRSEPALMSLHVHEVFYSDSAKALPGRERHYTPANDLLFEMLREPLRRALPDDTAYEECFDRFERLWSLAYATESVRRGAGPMAPMGRFVRHYRFLRDGETEPLFAMSLAAGGAKEKAIAAGLLVGDDTELAGCMKSLDQRAMRIAG